LSILGKRISSLKQAEATKQYLFQKWKKKKKVKKKLDAWWLTPIILATREAGIRRTTIQNQTREIV
jgi:hypothetical protein